MTVTDPGFWRDLAIRALRNAVQVTLPVVALAATGGYDTAIRYAGDYEFLLRLLPIPVHALHGALHRRPGAIGQHRCAVDPLDLTAQQRQRRGVQLHQITVDLSGRAARGRWRRGLAAIWADRHDPLVDRQAFGVQAGAQRYRIAGARSAPITAVQRPLSRRIGQAVLAHVAHMVDDDGALFAVK